MQPFGLSSHGMFGSGSPPMIVVLFFIFSPFFTVEF
jgi:hypothetical protein